MTRLLTGCIICVVSLAIAPSLCAASNTDQKAGDIAIPQTLQDYYYSTKLPEKLSYSIDLWYDAVLKGNTSEAQRLEGIIHTFVSNDIKADEQLLSILADQAKRLSATQERDSLSADSLTAPETFDKIALSQAWDVVNTKKLLRDGITNSAAFSNKYRLLGDYIELLRRELDMPRLKLALGDRNSQKNSTISSPRQN